MDIKIFEKGGATIVAQVITENKECCETEETCGSKNNCGKTDSWYVKNPKVVQAFQAPDQSGRKMLNVNLLPTVYVEFLKEPKEGFFVTFPASQYQDVTDQFNDHLADMYAQIEGQSEVKEDDEDAVEIFTS